MADYSIQITGLDATIRKVQRIGGSVGDSLLKGAEYLRGVLATYPAQRSVTRRSVYGTPFASDRQRRWFFASLADGSLQIPYRRTHNLGHRWTAEKESETQAIVGNNTPYARYVMDEDMPQSQFMAAVGWQTAQQIARRERAKIISEIERDLKAQLRGL